MIGLLPRKCERMAEVFQVSGVDVRPFLPDIARLRIRVFAQFPYLYEGEQAYEEKYLDVYAGSAHSMFVLVKDQGQVVGASTAIPLADESAAIKKPFLLADIDPINVMYFGESVLLPEYRGRGLGHEFFDRREAHAKDCGKVISAFCAVQRSSTDARKPTDYRMLDGFWLKRGYQSQPHLLCQLSWKEPGTDGETPKTLMMWTRRLLS